MRSFWFLSIAVDARFRAEQWSRCVANAGGGGGCLSAWKLLISDKCHHFLSLSNLFLSIDDETIPPPFVGYILSRYFSDSFKKFCEERYELCSII